MKHVLRVLIIGLFFALPAYAQVTPAPAPSTSCVNNGGSALSNLSVSGSATGFAVVGSSASTPVAATIVDASYQVTCHFSAGYETLVVPTLANYQFGMAHYTNQLSSFLGKKFSAKITGFDSTKVWVDLKLGAGKVLDSASNKSAFAATGGVGIQIPLNASVTWNTVTIQGVFGRIAGTSGVIVSPANLSSNLSISSGLSVSFGGKK